jgi:hypothetical protein
VAYEIIGELLVPCARHHQHYAGVSERRMVEAVAQIDYSTS